PGMGGRSTGRVRRHRLLPVGYFVSRSKPSQRDFVTARGFSDAPLGRNTLPYYEIIEIMCLASSRLHGEFGTQFSPRRREGREEQRRKGGAIRSASQIFRRHRKARVNSPG